MTFAGLSLEPSYETSQNRIVEQFYKPVLAESVLYQRVSAYFSLKGLSLAASGLEGLVQNHGRCEFVFSQDISEEDFFEIRKGYQVRELIQSMLSQEIEEDKGLKHNLGLLALMIAENTADVKIAFMRSQLGIFHDKFGLFTDSVGARVFFNGSSNESLGGLQNNYESLTVDVDWDQSERVRQRIDKNADRFRRIWQNEEKELVVVSANSLIYDQIKKFQPLVHAEQKHKTALKVANSDVRADDFCGWALELHGEDIVFVDATEEQLSTRNRHLKIDGDWTPKYFKPHSHVLRDDLVYSIIDRFIN
jgi:hypothetical protein